MPDGTLYFEQTCSPLAEVNDAKQPAESTMTVIMDRMSPYTGRALKCD
ncbi:MAG: hypothetical protein JSU94_16070 [Phycisphaerales bacterium]|nr:MAG: hypothetical protein JSU94_16070 [Phycisphaerales bacterium]